MKVTVKRLTECSLVLDLARATMGREEHGYEPSEKFKRDILASEHSPIRALMFHVRFTDIPYWVSVHLVRHKIGVEHWVRSQRDDRSSNDVPRADMPQGALVTHDMVLNAAAFIAISRKRLCMQASKETRYAWCRAVEALHDIGEYELFDDCVPECVHQGFRCPEPKSCGACPKVDPMEVM